MSNKNYIVDNLIVGTILKSISKSSIKLKNKIENNSSSSYFFVPSSLIDHESVMTQIDTYGILNKNKLLFREPIIREQISYVKFENEINYQNELHGVDIISNQNKTFYFYSIENFVHKYESSVFSNLSSNNVNIIFLIKPQFIFILQKKIYLKNILKN